MTCTQHVWQRPGTALLDSARYNKHFDPKKRLHCSEAGWADSRQIWLFTPCVASCWGPLLTSKLKRKRLSPFQSKDQAWIVCEHIEKTAKKKLATKKHWDGLEKNASKQIHRFGPPKNLRKTRGAYVGSQRPQASPGAMAGV